MSVTNAGDPLPSTAEELLQCYAEGRRDFSGLTLSAPDLSGAVLRGSDFSGCALEGANLTASDLTYCNFTDANLRAADLRHAILEGAKLAGVDFGTGSRPLPEHSIALTTSADLDYTNLRFADLTKAKMAGVGLYGARLFEASLAEADLRWARGLRLDGNLIRAAHFSPNSGDPWSVLRRKYTGPRLFFHLLFLIVFLIPYAVKAMLWTAANRTQITMNDIATQLEAMAAELAHQGATDATVLQRLLGRVTELAPCGSPSCDSLEIWQLLIGWDRGSPFVLATLAIVLYNVARGTLTSRVSALREEEERSGYCPPAGENAPWSVAALMQNGRWLLHLCRRLARHIKKRMGRELSPAILPLQVSDQIFPGGYLWLYRLHQAATALFVFAVLSFLWHAWHWARVEVWVPSIT